MGAFSSSKAPKEGQISTAPSLYTSFSIANTTSTCASTYSTTLNVFFMGDEALRSIVIFLSSSSTSLAVGSPLASWTCLVGRCVRWWRWWWRWWSGWSIGWTVARGVTAGHSIAICWITCHASGDIQQHVTWWQTKTHCHNSDNAEYFLGNKRKLFHNSIFFVSD